MFVLAIPQHEDMRYKVQKGRKIHEYKSITNTGYLRKKIGVVRKETQQYLYADKYHIHGIVDEILFLSDNTAAPLDYKFAEFKNRIYKTYRIQSTMYAMLIENNYKLPVYRGFLVYTRSKNHIEEIIFKQKDFETVIQVVEDIKHIITQNHFPKKTNVSSRCIDCCYRNICIK